MDLKQTHSNMMLKLTEQNRINKHIKYFLMHKIKLMNPFCYSIILITFTILSCTKPIEYIYCENTECSSGRYIIKESSIDFYTYIKDSINYKIEIKKETDFNEMSLLIVDSIMNIKNYLTIDEKQLLYQTKQNTETIKGKWVEEYCVNNIFDFNSQKELNTYKIAYQKWKCAHMIPIVKAFSKNEPKYLGVLDTLKNGKLMEKLIVNNTKVFKMKKNKLFYNKAKSQNIFGNLDIIDSVNIVFPKPITNISSYNIQHKLSKDRKTLVLFDSIYSEENIKNKSLIEF